MKSLDTIKWGIIGCGDVTEVKSGPALYKAPHSELVAVMRRNAALAEDYARRHNVPKWYQDAESLIHDADVNAVYIATPPSSHQAYAFMVAQAGKPCYVEKPMALSFEECQPMVAAFEEKDLPLFVAYYRRRLPLFVKAKELLAEGVIGEVRCVNIQLFHPPKDVDLAGSENNWRVNPQIAGGGYFVDLASHQLDILDYLISPIIAAQGIKTNQAGYYQAEDVVAASFQFRSGALGSGNWCFNAAPETRQDLIEIIGSAGSIRFSTFDNNPLLLTTSQGEQSWTFENPTHIQQPLIQSVNEALRGEGESPSTGKTAARTNWVIDQILK
ncbi:MAG: Gfo/Idh/MocA family oxidoreductase [Bacteroidota bacterium]